MLTRLLFWDYSRGSVQYDIACALILAFIFFTPPEFFRDQPKPKSVALLPSQAGTSEFWIEPGRLGAKDDAGRHGEAQTIVRQQVGGRDRSLVRLETIYDGEREVRGYLAITRP